MNTTNKPILDALLNASESFADDTTQQWIDFIERASGYDPNPLNDWPIPHSDIRGLIVLCKIYKAHAQRLAEALKPFADLLEYPDEYKGVMVNSVVQVEDIQAANKALNDWRLQR